MSVIEPDQFPRPDWDRHSPIIEQMRTMRGKPRGVDRTVLVDRETRLFNDRRWAEWDRHDQIMAARQPAPQRRSLWRRLFGL